MQEKEFLKKNPYRIFLQTILTTAQALFDYSGWWNRMMQQIDITNRTLQE